MLRIAERLSIARRPVVAWMLAAALALVVLGIALPSGTLSAAIARKQDDVARTALLLQGARKHIADSQALTRAPTRPRTDDPRAAIERALAQQGLQPTPAASHPTEGRVGVVIADAPFDRIVRAIDALAHDEGLHIVEARFTALVDPGRVRAELAFAR
jgi:type II secretory pathway component PulM